MPLFPNGAVLKVTRLHLFRPNADEKKSRKGAAFLPLGSGLSTTLSLRAFSGR